MFMLQVKNVLTRFILNFLYLLVPIHKLGSGGKEKREST